MTQIINAAKNGQYSLKIRGDYSKEKADIILTTLLNLGYTVQIETKKYIDTLKTFTDEITIHWHE